MQSAQTNAPNSEFMHVLLHNLAMSRNKNLNNKTAQILTVFQNRGKISTQCNEIQVNFSSLISISLRHKKYNHLLTDHTVINHVTFSVGQETAFWSSIYIECVFYQWRQIGTLSFFFCFSMVINDSYKNLQYSEKLNFSI